MKTEDLLEILDSVLARDSDIDEEGRNSISPSLRQVVPYEHERLLVAWVLLSRFPQEQLDRAWEKHGNELSDFGSCLLTNFDNYVDIFVDDHSNNFFYACCTRLVAQVTARLTIPPSEKLRRNVYDSWKHISILLSGRDMAESSTATEAAKLDSTIVALSVDVYNALVAWIEHGIAFSPSTILLEDIWNIPIEAYTNTKEFNLAFEEENREKQEAKTPMAAQPKVEENERTMMLNVFESVLRTLSETRKIDAGEKDNDIYTIGHLQRLIFIIFELQGTETVSDDLLRSISLWMRDRQAEMLDPDLRILWDGWLMKNVGEHVISKKSNLLRDPKLMEAIQNIILAHAVSPNANALRPMAWRTISQIVKSYGWGWVQKSSTRTSVCTWCRLACGEWKIQLENEKSDRSNRLSTLDGCGNLIMNIMQYLVDFDERPYQTIPLTTESVLRMKEALEETLFLTSAYLIINSSPNDHIESAIAINLWSELFTEIDLSTLKMTTNVISCFRNLLLVSDDESLVQPALHVVSTYCTEQQALNEVEVFDNSLIDAIAIYIQRYWKNVSQPDYFKKCSGRDDIIHSACVATEIIAEYKPPRFQHVVDAIFEAQQAIVDSFSTEILTQITDLKKSLRPISDTCVTLFEQFEEPLPPNTRLIISSALTILEGQ